MRINISDIMKAAKCTEEQANTVEQQIDADWLVDWSKDSQAKINRTAKAVFKQLFK